MTDDRLLTEPELAAIAARAEAYEYRVYSDDPDISTESHDDEAHECAADIPALLAHIRAQDAANARLRNDLAIIEQGCNSPWMTGAAFKDRVADIFAARRALLEGGV